MRIISGNSKGKKILEPEDLNTRPLKDLTKESIFNILIHSNKFKILLKDSDVLDLFAGVGSFGLECLSRGSKSVTFVENYKNVLPILKKNIINLGYQKNSLIDESNIMNNLNYRIFKKKFDIINRTEETLGELFCFFILETILLGRAMNINPYDQPSVELIKKETKKLLI